MKPSELNNEYDNQSLDWRDHDGLASKVARLFCHFNSDLTPYHADITEDLKMKTWDCLRPGNFDPNRGIRVSTYVCRAMIRHYNQICNLYLGYMPRNKYKHRNTVSLHVVSGDSTELVHFLGDETHDEGRAQDLATVLEMVEAIAGPDRFAKMLEYYKAGRGKDRSHTAKRSVQRDVERMREEWPEVINTIEDFLGVGKC